MAIVIELRAAAVMQALYNHVESPKNRYNPEARQAAMLVVRDQLDVLATAHMETASIFIMTAVKNLRAPLERAVVKLFLEGKPERAVEFAHHLFQAMSVARKTGDQEEYARLQSVTRTLVQQGMFRRG